MKCPDKKQLILFYYQELGKKQNQLLKEHLTSCLSCTKEYESIESTFSQIKLKPLELGRSQIDDIVQNIKFPLNKILFSFD